MRRHLALSALVLMSCGGQRAPSAVLTLPTATASASPIATDTPPDLSPVAAPEGLIATMRLARPRHTMDQWSSLVTALGVPKLAVNLDDIAKDELGAHVIAALDLDAPIDVVVVKAPGSEWIPGGAVSIAITPGDAAMDLLARGFQLEQKSDGSIAIRKASDGGAPPDESDAGDDDEIADDTRCIVAPPIAPTPRRLVCVYGGVEFATVVPYLTRTLARQPASQTSDFRAELLLDKHRDEIRKLEEMAKGSASSAADDPGEAFGASFASDASKSFFDDLDVVAFDATLDDEAISLSFSARFGHSASPFTKMMLSNADGAALPQDAFWQLPIDTSFALYTHGANAKDLEPLREELFTAMTSLLSTEGVPASGVDLANRSMRSVFLTGGPEVIGAGFDTKGATTALAVYVALGKDTLAARTKARAAMQGWTLFEVHEPASRWTAAMKDFVALDKLPPKKKAAKSAEPEKEKSVLVVTPTPAALGLPPGTFHVERRATPLPPPPKKPGDTSVSYAKAPPIANTTHIFVVPDGSSTWIALGEDAAMVAVHVKAALSTAPASGTMKRKAGLERLSSGKTTSGAFATLAWGALAFLDDDSDSDLKDASTWLEKLSRWPSHGTTPMEAYVTPLPPTEGSLGGRTITYRLPREALGDIVKAF
jgi:hypothetical protein